MMKKFVKGLTAAAAAAVLAVGMIPAIPAMPVKAAALSSFDQEIIINDVTDGSHTSNVMTPDIKVEYLLTPVTDSSALPANDSRYVKSLADFPQGNVLGATSVLDKKVTIASATTDTTGKITQAVAASTILTKADGTNALEYGASKVYRYRIIISGIFFVGDDTTNLLNSTQTDFTLPSDTTRLLDVSTDSNKAITGIAFWDAAGTNKLDGYVGDEGGIKYNVSDIVVSSDYIGKNWDSLHGGFSYSINLTNFPSYFTKAGILKSMDDKGRSWDESSDTGVTNTYGRTDVTQNTCTLKGTFDQNSSLVLFGMPAGVKYSATIDFSQLKTAGAGGSDIRSQYGPAIFYGLNADQVTDVEDMTAFFSSSYADKYKYKAYETDKDTRTTADIDDGVTSNTAAAVQTARFVIFDPNQLIVVGVLRRTAPAVLMVAVAAAILAALAASKKRALADTRYDFR
ncbi:MAG: hypothetical protein VZQ80_07155 [Lachnospiraceae bacterium]|nr:hypothetical protein [Lachnospiraceae bacterium]